MTDPDTPRDLGTAAKVHDTASVRATSFGSYCEVGAHTKIAESSFGDYSYVAHDSDIMHTTVGRFCSIAAHTRINPGNHPLDRVMMSHVGYRSSAYGLGEDDSAFFAWRASTPVVLEHDVWLGHGAVVLPGITIGTGAAVGAGAIVTRDVAPFTIVVGNPARLLRPRFAPDIIDALTRIAWWNWPHDRLRLAMADIRRFDAGAFCAKYNSPV